MSSINLSNGPLQKICKKEDFYGTLILDVFYIEKNRTSFTQAFAFHILTLSWQPHLYLYLYFFLKASSYN